MLNLPKTQETNHYHKKRDKVLMKTSKETAPPYSYWDEAFGNAVADCVVLRVISSTGTQ